MINNTYYNSIQLVENILVFINENKIQNQRIGLLFNFYCEKKGGQFISYKSFQRVIEELSERELIEVQKLRGGLHGTTTIISYIKNKVQK